jgi:formate dehydrogenase maturation protein FdhE
MSALLDQAALRWTQLAGERPDTLRAISLNRRLLTRQIALVEDPDLIDVDRPLTARGELLESLRAGVPVLPLLQNLQLPLERLRHAMADFLDHLAWGGAGEAARKIARALAADTLDTGAAVRASLARNDTAARHLAGGLGLNLPVLWLAVDLAVAPVAHRLQQAVLEEQADGDVRDAVEQWRRGACPACGSWPALAEFFGGERLNRCAYCACMWPFGGGCTYCGQSGAAFRTIALDARTPGRRLELCRGCGGYLKTIDVERPTPFPLLAIEDLATGDLDTAAARHGFRRISLSDARRSGT